MYFKTQNLHQEYSGRDRSHDKGIVRRQKLKGLL